jgi:hypothetical protein
MRRMFNKVFKKERVNKFTENFVKMYANGNIVMP